jgi:transposase
MAAVDAGMSKSEAARVFRVGISTIRRYAARRRATNSLAPTRNPGATPLITPDQYPALEAQLAAHPDATLDEHCRHWKTTHDVQVSLSTMSRTQRRLGYTRKKSPSGRRSVTRKPVPPSAP